MNKPNKTELEYFIRYSLDSDKYKRYMELYDEIERLEVDYSQANDIIVEQSKEIERIENENERYRIALNEMAIIISNAIEYLTDDGVCILNKGMKENEQLVWTWENYYDLLDILKGEDE